MPKHFDLKRATAGLEAITKACTARGRVLILMQDNPDPDALASATALRELIHVLCHKRAVIGYGGLIGRAENRSMLSVLRIDARRVSSGDLSKYKVLCMVDAQPRSGNNALYTKRPADVVIDHHLSPKKTTYAAGFCDIRPEYGAASTILYEYFCALERKPNSNLATALFYGIRSDTQDLGRETSPADTAAFLELFPLVDRKKLGRIRRAPMAPAYFQRLHDSLGASLVSGRTAISFIPEADTPDLMADVADQLLRLESIRMSVCYGICGDNIYLSARAVDARGNVYTRIKRTVSRIGTGGGHRTMAAGQIPLGDDPGARLTLVRNRILRLFANGKNPLPLSGA
jgi:nanoRNase/pAp phosphatase (c-di-AMP/oligoRNAs hydrolase)